MISVSIVIISLIMKWGRKAVELVLDKIKGKREVEFRIRLDASLEPPLISAKQKFAARKTQEIHKKS